MHQYPAPPMSVDHQGYYPPTAGLHPSDKIRYVHSQPPVSQYQGPPPSSLNGPMPHHVPSKHH